MTEVCAGPPEAIWELITDWEHQDDWMLEASDFVVVSDAREGVGVEAEATVRIGGIATRDRVRVAEWDPPRRLVIEHLGWVTGRGTIELTPVAGRRTHVWWQEHLEPPLGLLGAAGMRVFRPLMHRVFTRDLRVLASLARVRSESTRT
ncbi:MAG TPA: SRPBCC family protein [Actinomycetota bacterium]|nr:SRPBCC family protein [Actinomycetota bacterium]